jgi:hypothetical protein
MAHLTRRGRRETPASVPEERRVRACCSPPPAGRLRSRRGCCTGRRRRARWPRRPGAHQRLGAVVPGADRDPSAVQDGGQVVRVHVGQGEGDHPRALLRVARSVDRRSGISRSAPGVGEQRRARAPGSRRGRCRQVLHRRAQPHRPAMWACPPRTCAAAGRRWSAPAPPRRSCRRRRGRAASPPADRAVPRARRSRWGRTSCGRRRRRSRSPARHVHRQVRRGLRAVHHHQRAHRPRALGDLAHRVDGAQRVGDVRERDEPRPLGEQLVQPERSSAPGRRVRGSAASRRCAARASARAPGWSGAPSP